MRYLEGTNILCLEYAEYVRDNIVSPELFRQQRHRKDILAHGNGEKALIEYESIPHKYRAKVRAKYGDPYEYASREPLRKLITEDMEARNFYAKEYLLPTGERLDIEVQRDYSRQCDYLNLITLFLKDKKAFKKLLNTSTASIWQNIIQIAKADRIKHSLPRSQKRILVKHKKYTEMGYPALVEEWRYGNNHARLVTEKIENLILSIYAQYEGRTSATQAAKDYNAFIRGQKQLIDLSTGEVFQPEDFRVKGKIHLLEPSLIGHYINKKHNREAIDLMQLGGGDYTQKHRPHNRRHAPRYAFSTVSMDDYLPPFKTLDGKRTVWMYAIFDVASTAIVGIAYGTKKNWGMVLDALADMAANCLKNDWGLPLELEMERSLNYEHRGTKENPDIFTEGYIFPHIRFVRGGNSQGKIVERFLRTLKYEELAKETGFLGRPHGRDENYRYNKDKAEIHYPVNELIKRLKAAVNDYNNTPFKDGLTRWEWLCNNINPDTVKYAPQTLLPEVGKLTKTSIHRQLVTVKGNRYEVPLEVTDRLHSTRGRIKVDAWYLPDENAQIDKVYLYQNGKFICEAAPADTYNYSTAERTAEDWEIMQRQTAKQKAFMQRSKRRLAEIPTVGLMNTEGLEVVRKSYDKLAEETEDYAALRQAQGEVDAEKTPEKPEKMHKKAPKQGGYVQKFDPENIVTNAISSL